MTDENKTMKDDPENYPCADCGKPRTKAEGGTTFTVCDECWDKAFPPKGITKDDPEECSNVPDQATAKG